MDELYKQVRRARQRLIAEQFLKALGWCWSAALLAALAAIAVGKIYPLGLIEWAWALGALGLGLVLAAIWTYQARQKVLDAALEIDRRFGLKERVSSSLALSAGDRQTEAGQALLSDAARRVGRIDVTEKFRVRLPRQLLLPLLPAAALALVALRFPAAVAEQRDAPDPTLEAEAQQPEVKRSAETLEKRLADRREKAEKQGLREAELLLKKMEEGAKEIKAQPDREKALMKFNDLARQLDQRKQQLGGADKIKQQLEQLKTVERGPAEEFARAMGKGDFKKAAEELSKLKDELAKSKLDQAQKEALARQLDDMQQKIDKLAKAAEDAKADLQKRADDMRQAGQGDEADKLQQQINKLVQQAPQMKQLQDLAQKLGECSNCMRQGEGDQAGQSLKQAMDQLNNLQQKLDELETLDGAMEQLAQARNQMSCPNCKGAGCEACMGGMGQGDDKDNLKPGFGLGRGKGDGARPEQKTDTSLFNSQVRQKVGRGSGEVTDLTGGPNVKGKVEAEIQQQVEAARRGSADPLSGRRLPRKHGEQAREYFDRFRDGK